ncbi:hypothetical protein BH11MYX1_BH11MYX1_32500 [soil metagenome]
MDSVDSVTPTVRSTSDQARSSEPALITISGLIDEHFAGFGEVGPVTTLVMNVTGITRMTSFGVRQWLVAMAALPRTITDLYLVGCPTSFVDQLNMMLNFGGNARVLTVAAPYRCSSCDAESEQLIDVLATRTTLTREAPERDCARCGGKLEFDETPESYFAFVAKYAPPGVTPQAAKLLAEHQLYYTAQGEPETPPRILKLVHGAVTYFRITGTIGSLFRARPFLVGTEGEVVIDLADVDRFEPTGEREWRRLIETLAAQVAAITLVDVPQSLLITAGDTVLMSRTISVASLRTPYVCLGCGRKSQVSHNLTLIAMPLELADSVCSTCGELTRCQLAPAALVPLEKASTKPPPASANVALNRDELLSRAKTDENVARAQTPRAVPGHDVIGGKYEIIRPLSSGGMAEVFLAKLVGIGGFERIVAIKRVQNQLLETRRQAVELFLNEAKIAGQLTHPNIVAVLDVGEVGGALFQAMEYVHGKDLREVLKQLRKHQTVMSVAEACHVVREIASALDYAYWSTDMNGKQLSVVHRDVSPHNVMVGFDGAVKLLDFGVAMSAITEHERVLVVGKWSYMSPEAATDGKVDHRSDLFSLGVIFYLALTGTSPFSAKEPAELTRKIRARDYTPLEELAPQVPPRIAALVARMLEPNADSRPARGADIVAELNEIIREYGLERSPQNIALMMASLFAGTDGPRVTEAAGLKHPRRREESVSSAVRNPDRSSMTTGSGRRRTVSLSGVSALRSKSTTRQPLPLARASAAMASPSQRARLNTMINLAIGIAIIAVLVLAVYLIASKS